MKEAKKALGFNEDDYLVVNMNRNTYRKMIPKTIEAFVEFLKMNDMNEKNKELLQMKSPNEFPTTCHHISNDVVRQRSFSFPNKSLDPKVITHHAVFCSTETPTSCCPFLY